MRSRERRSGWVTHGDRRWVQNGIASGRTLPRERETETESEPQTKRQSIISMAAAAQ